MDDGWDSDDGSGVVSTNKQFEVVNNPRGSSNWDDRSSGADYKSNRNYNNRSDGPRKQYKSDNSYQNRGGGGGGDNDSFEIPSDSIGKIIGRGGSKIEELQNESGARINIDRNPNGGPANVRLSGPSDAIERARDAIQRIVNNSSDGRRGGDGGGGGGGYGGRRDNSRQQAYSNSDNKNDTWGNSNKTDSWGAGSKNNDSWGQKKDFNSGNNNDSWGNSAKNDNGGEIDWAEANRIQEAYLKEKWSKLPPLTKQFYAENEEVKQFSEKRIAEIRARNNDIKVSRLITHKDVESPPIPNPVETFEQCFRNFPDILEEIRKNGFAKPSPIQCQAWPVLLSGQDLIGIAQTGTGKTLAFLLPAFIHICGQSTPRGERGGPNVLVYSPTRELALQIKREVDKYQYQGIKAVCLYGGGSRKEQIEVVGEGVDIIIATPGRLNDLVNNNIIDITSVTYLVLDEADRMLDMGFEPQIRKTLLDIRPDRQTIMTSATWPNSVRRLAESYMCNPVQVQVGSLDLAATHTVTQEIIFVPGDQEADDWKFNEAINFIKNMESNQKVIIFCMRKTKADHISSELAMQGISVQCMHGSLDQSDREQALEDITSGKVKALIATDLASRGLDIEDITHVINYDFPKNIEEYVHRVGRTGRAGRSGKAISYFTRNDWGHAAELIPILEEANQVVPDELYNMSQRFSAMKERRDREGGSRGGRFGGRGGGGYGGGGGRRGGGGGRY